MHDCAVAKQWGVGMSPRRVPLPSPPPAQISHKFQLLTCLFFISLCNQLTFWFHGFADLSGRILLVVSFWTHATVVFAIAEEAVVAFAR